MKSGCRVAANVSRFTLLSGTGSQFSILQRLSNRQVGEGISSIHLRICQNYPSMA